MSANANALLVEQGQFVLGLASAVPSSSTPDYVSLKNYRKLTAVILVANAASGVTGSAITLKQATAVAGTSEKALAFSNVWANTDCATSDTLVKTSVSSNTFTTDATGSKNLMYVVEINSEDLDVANGFDCVRVGTGNATLATVTVLYYLGGSRYEDATPPSAIVD